MSQIKYPLLLLVALLAAAVPRASATTYYVGRCRVGSFSTISDALAATPAPDVVYVCPGTYPEQVTMTKPVTLEGISSGGANQVFITVPSGGLKFSCEGASVQVCVNNTGPVNITNITVDGTGAKDDVGSIWGIFYNNSSGTVSYVETRFQGGGPVGGVGIEISQELANTVTVENSNMHSFTGWGIQAIDNSSSGEATVRIVGNTVDPEPGASGGIGSFGGASVTISGNVIQGPLAPADAACKGGNCVGVVVYLPTSGSISKNIIVGSAYAGIQLYPYSSVDPSPMSVISNTIFDVGGDGIQLKSCLSGSCAPTTSVSIEDNVITQAQNGINFSCTVYGTIKGNTISAIHSFGLANVPAGLTPSNIYFNVPTISSSGSCP